MGILILGSSGNLLWNQFKPDQFMSVNFSSNLLKSNTKLQVTTFTPIQIADWQLQDSCHSSHQRTQTETRLRSIQLATCKRDRSTAGVRHPGGGILYHLEPKQIGLLPWEGWGQFLGRERRKVGHGPVIPLIVLRLSIVLYQILFNI